MKKHLSFLILVFSSFFCFSQLKSSATLRLEAHAQSGNCDVSIPNNPEWNIDFERFDLKGDLAPNTTYNRRDPSSVLKVNGKYYVWYSYSLTYGAGKIAPWDLNDLYYATSVDGITWEEHGAAIERGPAGSFDHRSAFTTEVFYHDDKFYLIYQAAADTEGVFGKNTIAMAYATSPDGPWTKLSNPILSPTVGNAPAFDKNAVHDPCIVYFKNKFYLYYKGEGDENNVCGLGVWNLDKQVKWGVAISDNVTGPYVKSEYNPVTNTGHEVCVWNSGDGIGIMLYQDGPEFATLQYAEDGVNFDIKGKVLDFIRLNNYLATDFPEAAGVYRSVNDEISPVSGVSWGISHILRRVPGDQSQAWQYLRRFENKNKTVIVDDSDNQGIVIDNLSIKQVSNNTLTIYPNPVKDNLYIKNNKSNTYDFKIISLNGKIVYKGIYNSTVDSINVSKLENGLYILKLTDVKTKKSYFKNFILNRNK